MSSASTAVQKFVKIIKKKKKNAWKVFPNLLLECIECSEGRKLYVYFIVSKGQYVKIYIYI